MQHQVHDELFQLTYPCAASLTSFAFMNRGSLDFIAGYVRQHGLESYEPPTPGLVVSLIQGEAAAFLDVGANTGLFSLLVAAANPEVRVFAFEPLPRIREVLEANRALNPALSDRIHVQKMALSNQAGSFTFFETVNDQGFLTTSSSLEISHAQTVDHGNFLKTEVETQTLDGWASTELNALPLRLMKIDVETHEHAVIDGGRDTIARHRPMIVLEVLPGADVRSIQRMIDEERYLVFALAPDALLQSVRLSYTSLAGNHLLCPVEQVDRVFWLARQHRLQIRLA